MKKMTIGFITFATLVIVGALVWTVSTFSAPTEPESDSRPLTEEEWEARPTKEPTVTVTETPTVKPTPTPLPMFKAYPEVQLSEANQEYLHAECVIYDLDYDLMLALLITESNGVWQWGDWDSSKQEYRSVGFFQIRDTNFKWLNENGIDPTTEQGNLKAGCFMMADLAKKYPANNLYQLTAYKAGEYGAKSIMEDGIVLRGVSDVFNLRDQLKRDHGGEK